jgi:N-acetylglucosamine kinase-like BadF-type ATPase
MPPAVVIGVDGGGTKTAAVALEYDPTLPVRANLVEVGRFTGASSNR